MWVSLRLNYAAPDYLPKGSKGGARFQKLRQAG